MENSNDLSNYLEKRNIDRQKSNKVGTKSNAGKKGILVSLKEKYSKLVNFCYKYTYTFIRCKIKK